MASGDEKIITHRSISWQKAAAIFAVLFGIREALTWGWNQVNDHAGKIARNDSAYVVAYRAESLAKQNFYAHRRDSVRIDELQLTLKRKK